MNGVQTCALPILTKKLDIESKDLFLKLKQKCEEITERIKNTELDIKSRENEIDRLKNDLMNKENLINKLQMQIMDLKREMSQRKEVEEVKSEPNLSLADNNETLIEELDDHKKVILTLCEEKGMAEIELASIKENMDKILSEQVERYEQKDQEINYLHNLINGSELTINDLKNKLMESSNELEALLKENEKLKASINSLNNELNWLKKDKAKIEAQEKMENEEIERMSKEIVGMAEDVAKLKGENNELKLKIDELKQQLELNESVESI